MKSIEFLSAALVWPCLGTALAQEGTKTIHEEILAVYSFSPHTLTKEQQSQKSMALDAFWQKARAQRKV